LQFLDSLLCGTSTRLAYEEGDRGWLRKRGYWNQSGDIWYHSTNENGDTAALAAGTQRATPMNDKELLQTIERAAAEGVTRLNPLESN